MKTITELIDEMIQYKISMGGSRSTFLVLYNFRDYALKFPVEKQLSQEVVYEWSERRTTENNAGYVRRLSSINELIKYCFAMKYIDYEFDTDLRPAKVLRYEPYIFSDNELYDVFEAASKVPFNKYYPLRHLVIDTIFRLTYTCGLRPTEVRMLQTDDVNLKDGTLFIRKNKRRAERIVPMAEDVTEMCRNYIDSRKNYYQENPYLFPSGSKIAEGQCYSSGNIQNIFKQLWNSIAEDHKNIKVRVYDLRHRFATASIINLLEAGYDIDNIIPYLSAYMGHTEFQHTYYYIHLIPKRLLESKAIDLAKYEQYIPEVEPYDE